MSSVKLQGGASGAGSVALVAPNTNFVRSLTLPDFDGLLVGSTSAGTAGQILLSGGAGAATWQSTVGTGNVVLATSPTITNARGVKVALGAGTSIDVNAGDIFTKTISGATTLTLSNVPAAGALCIFALELTNGGSATVTLWGGIKWAAGIAPTLTVAGRDTLVFYTHDGGTTWTGFSLLDTK